jgi:hypothetical protein
MLPVIAAFLTGCANTPASHISSRPITSAWFLGYWVPSGEDCESDAGIDFNADGTWAAYDVSGTWKVVKNQLITVTTQRGDPGDPEVSLTPPERHEERIKKLSADKYLSHRSEGAPVEMLRCPKQNS